jgi:hypothetical protein
VSENGPNQSPSLLGQNESRLYTVGHSMRMTFKFLSEIFMALNKTVVHII